MSTFEHEVGDYKRQLKRSEEKLDTPFGKGIDQFEEGKETGAKNSDKYLAYEIERGEEGGYFNKLREELKAMQGGGVDRHFGYFNVNGLSDKTIDFYRQFKKEKLDEKKLDEYISRFSPGDNEYNFVALLRNWIQEKKCLDVEKEKRELKQKAERKFNELKKRAPHISAYVNDKVFNSLRRFDYRMTVDLNEANFSDYESNLREYFKNKTMGKQDEGLAIIEEDPRFKYYCAMKEALGLGPCQPDVFIK
ncbi:MAG: hypothetical protein WC608_05160 [Parcubacteria group bacterium]